MILIQTIFYVFAKIWWLIIPTALIAALPRVWLYFRQVRYLKSIKWQMLEIKVPRDITKTPKAMEQIFSAVYSIYSYGLRPYQVWWEGVTEDRMSFEIAGHAGSVRFFVRVASGHRNLIEAAIYSQYPDAEIMEAPDYVNDLPPALPNPTYDVFGLEFVFAKPDPYPIRTYPFFESAQETALEEKRVDPISALTEIMAGLNEDEHLWIQIVIRPNGDEWKKEGDRIVNEAMGKKEPKKMSWIEEAFIFFLNFFKAPVEYPTWPESEEETKPQVTFMMLSPGMRFAIEAIENKTAKMGFEATIRFVYIDRRTSFTRRNVAAALGAIHQYNTQNLNALQPNKKTASRLSKRAGEALLRPRRLYLRKKYIHKYYRERRLPDRKIVLNTEELATLYHFPIGIVRAPTLERLEAKKGEPPVTLPTE